MKKTVVIGASPNLDRYSYKAVSRLMFHGHQVLALGIRSGEIEGITIHTDRPLYRGVDTITIYLNPIKQKDWYEYILALRPKRIIFNPGTENPELESMARINNIQPINACTLVLLATNQY